jgi:hypothetical protein
MTPGLLRTSCTSRSWKAPFKSKIFATCRVPRTPSCMSYLQWHLHGYLYLKGCWRLVCLTQPSDLMHQMLGGDQQLRANCPDGPTINHIHYWFFIRPSAQGHLAQDGCGAWIMEIRSYLKDNILPNEDETDV